MSVEIIETKSRAEAIAQFKTLRGDPDVVGVEFLKAGKVLRVTRAGDPEEEPEEVGAPVVEVPGVVVESETAGTGEVVNAATGETTAPGEALPQVEQSDGVELHAAEPAAEPVPAGEPTEAPADEQATPVAEPGETPAETTED